MSYERIIGFGVHKDNPKAQPRAPHHYELSVFKKMGVKPFFISLKEWMPEGNKEPEQKIFLPNAQSFNLARQLITNAKNANLIPGQNYEDKKPLTSILLDTSRALLDQSNYTLRYRFEMCPETGNINQGDYNEKSGMKGGNVIGGCVDRFEREREQVSGETYEDAYYSFVQKYRDNNDPAHCNNVSFRDLHVASAYQCARNEIGVVFKHPRDNVMFVFEMCEDIWHGTQPNMCQMLHKYYELEFEVKQVWGQLPERVKTKEDFKEYVYSSMTMFRDYLQANIPHAVSNMKSKAEITKEDLEREHGLTKPNLEQMGLFRVFEYAVNLGGNNTLANVMEHERNVILHMNRQLHLEKEAFNRIAIQPTAETIGKGSIVIPFSHYNKAPSRKAELVAAAA